MNKHKFTRLTAGLLSILMLPSFSLSANAEEEIVKNFEYFHSLSDYEVYVEYHKTYTEIGYKLGEILDIVPTDSLDLPHYGMHLDMTDDDIYGPIIEYYVDCTAECMLDEQEFYTDFYSSDYDPDGDGMYILPRWLSDSPEFFGFPEEWGKKLYLLHQWKIGTIRKQVPSKLLNFVSR